MNFTCALFYLLLILMAQAKLKHSIEQLPDILAIAMDGNGICCYT
jgi:hypothetical protein